MASHLEITFAHIWTTYYPDIDLHSEWRFSPPRRYRFDFAHLPSKTAIELQGGIWQGKARHNSGSGLVKEYEKMNLAAALGWRVFYLCSNTINDEAVYRQIADAIKAETTVKVRRLLHGGENGS